jgi:cardiolipin synthase
MTLPNFITVARFVMVPLIILAMIDGEMLAAFLLFMLAGISDGVWTASLPGISTSVRSWDPGLIPWLTSSCWSACFIMLGWLGELPSWLVIFAVSRDALIVGAVVLSSLLDNPVEMRPLLVSKANTMFQIVLLILVLADLAGLAQLDSVVGWMIYAVAGLTIASASAYLVTWLRHMAGVNQPD